MRPRGKRTDRQADKWTDRHRVDRHGQTDRQKDRQTDRRQDKTGIMVMKINCRLDSSHKIHL